MTDLNLPTPFKVGDIIAFKDIYGKNDIHALVLFTMKPHMCEVYTTHIGRKLVLKRYPHYYQDCCMPFILYLNGDRLRYEALKHLYAGNYPKGETSSPLLTVRLFRGKLTGRERILK